jgi:hypothetical protein
LTCAGAVPGNSPQTGAQEGDRVNPQYRSPPPQAASLIAQRASSRTSSRTWPIALPVTVLVLLAALWSGFWYYASVQAETTVAAWRGHEADAGRSYDCSRASFGGYPFRIEYNCADPAVDDRMAALSIRAHNLTAVAQVWDPTLVIGEIVAPLMVAPLGAAPIATIDWKLAQASLRGRPGAPERLSIVLDKPTLAAPVPGAADPLVKAEHAEFHARFAADSTAAHPALDLALDASQVTAPGLATVLGAPLAALLSGTTSGTVVAVLRGANDLAPKPMAQALREWQAGDGQLDITNARFTQGDVVVTASGTLSLAPRGTLAGELRLTVVNFEKLIPLLGIDRAIARAMPPDTLTRFAPGLDRLIPGLGNVLRGASGGGANAGTVNLNGAAAALGAAALGGQPSELEGQRAVTLTLRFDDGAASLGPLKLGQVPPLY